MKDTRAYLPLPFKIEPNLISHFTIYAECYKNDPDMHESFDIEEFSHSMEMWAAAYDYINFLKKEGYSIIFRPEIILSESDYES